MVERVKNFIGAVGAEFKRISWPSRRQLMVSSALVLFVTFLLAAYLGIVDYIILKVINFILR